MAIKTYQVSVNQVNGVKMEIEARSHKIIVDEPLTAGGTDEGMNPVEIMLGSLGACQAITTAIFAKMYGIKIDGIRVEVEGDKDSDGISGANPNVRPGFQNIRFHYYVKSNMPEERIRQLLSIAERKCPVGDSINHGVPFDEPALTMVE